MEIVNLIRLRLGDIVTSDDVIKYYISEVEQEIKNFCNIGEVPIGLNFTIINMVVDLILSNKYQINPEELEMISSVREGDTKISYILRDALEKRAIDNVIRAYKSQLMRFRKLRW